MLTFYVSAAGIGDYGEEELLALLEKAGLVRILAPGKTSIGVMKFTEDSGNEFFSVNIKAGDEEGTCAEAAAVYPFRTLNAFNRKRAKAEGGTPAAD